MPKVWVRATLRLEPPLMLSVAESHDYGPISWTSPAGVEVTAELNLDVEEFNRVRSGLKADQVDWVCGPAESMVLQLGFTEFGEKEISSLRSADGPDTFVRNGVRYRLNEELGRRIAEETYEAAQAVLDVLRINLGQHWLSTLSLHDEPQSSLDAVRAEWRTDPSEEWARLFVGPWVSRMEIPFGGEGDYVQLGDWSDLGEAMRSGRKVSASIRLMSEARGAFQSKLPDLAVVKLHSATELAVQGFLATRLGPFIPEQSLERLLRQAHGRLLDDWIKPWLREEGREPEPQVLEAAKRLQRLRADAGHPIRDEGLSELTQREFQELVVRISEFIELLTGLQPPRFPVERHVFGAVGKAANDE